MTDENEIVKPVAAEEFSVELTEKEKLAIEKEARAEVLKTMKADAKEAFKEAAKKRIEADMMFSAGKDDKGEDLGTIDLYLASTPKYIMLDGAVYHSGRTYTKKKSVIAVLADQMDRGWRQEEARRGEKVENFVYESKKVFGKNGLRVTH